VHENVFEKYRGADFSALIVWMETPPKPIYWMHQLTDGWATKDNYRTGDDLKNELLISMEKVIPN